MKINGENMTPRGYIEGNNYLINWIHWYYMMGLREKMLDIGYSLYFINALESLLKDTYITEYKKQNTRKHELVSIIKSNSQKGWGDV